MSRIGRMPINIPQGVTVTIKKNHVTVNGPKGELSRTVNAEMNLKLSDTSLEVSRPTDNREHRAMHGLTRTLIDNMVQGVTTGFEKILEIVGVGYRVQKEGENLVLNIGYSHKVEIIPLPGISFTLEGNSRIKVFGIDKEVVGQMAAQIRAVRPPDAYKGKGIRYSGEIVRLKPGKAGKAVGRV